MAETTDGDASLPTVSPLHLTCNDNSVLPTLLVTNVRSLFQKIDELQSIAEINQVNIICITESWLTPSCPDPTISLTNLSTSVMIVYSLVAEEFVYILTLEFIAESLSILNIQILNHYGLYLGQNGFQNLYQ